MSVAIHPAAAIFPIMEDAAVRELAEDIRTNGQNEPIVFWKNKLLDGRNRNRACELIGIEPDFCEIEDDVDPVAYVLSANLHRRHLSTSQQAMVAARVKSIYSQQAKERQGVRTDLKDNIPEKLPESKSNGDARDQAGAAVGVSGKTVDHATTVIEKGSKALQQAVDSGEISVSKAATIAKSIPKSEQIEVAKSKKVTPPKRFPLSDQYTDMVGKMSVALVQVDEDFGGIRGLISSDGWDKSETKIFKQQVVALLRILNRLKKELDDE